MARSRSRKSRTSSRRRSRNNSSRRRSRKSSSRRRSRKSRGGVPPALANKLPAEKSAAKAPPAPPAAKAAKKPSLKLATKKTTSPALAKTVIQAKGVTKAANKLGACEKCRKGCQDCKARVPIDRKACKEKCNTKKNLARKASCNAACATRYTNKIRCSMVGTGKCACQKKCMFTNIGEGAGRVGRGVSSAAEATGRQAEAAGDIRTTALIMSALIEGVALFAAATCFLLQGK